LRNTVRGYLKDLRRDVIILSSFVGIKLANILEISTSVVGRKSNLVGEELSNDEGNWDEALKLAVDRDVLEHLQQLEKDPDSTFVDSLMHGTTSKH
jgi:hypothetical protein